MTHQPIVGIDLGTTFSLIGRMRDGKPVLVPNSSGGFLHASAIFLDETGTYHIGAAARSRAVLAPDRAAMHFKRDMGTGRETVLGNTFRPEDLSALMLRYLKELAEAHWGETIERAVISVPAYFGEAQRQATRLAARIAGLEVVRLINEPTAAAIAYGLDRPNEELKVAVLDLGGGTFDVTLLEILEGVIEIHSTSGDLRLGGLDFDNELVRWIRSTSEGKGIEWSPDSATNARLLEIAERAKKALSTNERVDISLGELLDTQEKRQSLVLLLERSRAEVAWAGLAERLLRPVRQALLDAQWQVHEIDEVILVGGSTRIPLVRRVFHDFFGKAPTQPLPPDEAVAIGAVLTAGLMAEDAALDEVVVTDIAPFTMGTELAQHDGSVLVTGIYQPIIERGTVIPCSRTLVVRPISRLQTSLEIPIYQGEHALCEKNSLLGKLRIKNIPIDEPSIEVRYTYDLNGILEVVATVLATGVRVTSLIQQGERKLEGADLEIAVREMQNYKIHPEDKIENVALLAQGEILFANTLGVARQRVADEITNFRMALKSQDDAIIHAARVQFQEFLRQVW